MPRHPLHDDALDGPAVPTPAERRASAFAANAARLARAGLTVEDVAEGLRSLGLMGVDIAPFHDFPPGTVKALNREEGDVIRCPDGTWAVTYRFAYRPGGWDEESKR